jgi:hypothetical protein
MTERVPQTDPWKAPPEPPRGRWVAYVAIAIGVVVVLAIVVGALVAG